MASTWERNFQQDTPQHRPKTPSFSSSLLDAIYRSIDESNIQQEDFVLCKRNNVAKVEEEIANLRRTIMIEKWMENRSLSTSRSSRPFNSYSSSSESSIFSSSETESKPSNFRAKQARPTVLERSDKAIEFETTPKREGRFMRTKSRALKIYGDLKKVKQPISPGGKITTFLNSLFNSRNVRNSKNNEALERKSRSVKEEDSSKTTCLSNSNFSRSCLSKKPSNRGNNKSKRSVKFCPVSVIVDEDCRPCGHKNIYKDETSLIPPPIVRKLAETAMVKELNNQFMEKSNAERKNFRAYSKKGINFFDLGDFRDDDVDNDGDGESCSSSDLFELENIGGVGVGIGGYMEELPVYGTTSLKANQAIADGLIL
ncbi:unnamed protein product [Ilex paraguariensis]|uniref:Protein BIG GRAIN 1-like B n=1 Tax=Ilex paraguariensis TaxID=185542 RepID=A0ABC8RND9_9AQUA